MLKNDQTYFKNLVKSNCKVEAKNVILAILKVVCSRIFRNRKFWHPQESLYCEFTYV